MPTSRAATFLHCYATSRPSRRSYLSRAGRLTTHDVLPGLNMMNILVGSNPIHPYTAAQSPGDTSFRNRKHHSKRSWPPCSGLASPYLSTFGSSHSCKLPMQRCQKPMSRTGICCWRRLVGAGIRSGWCCKGWLRRSDRMGNRHRSMDHSRR